MQYVIRVIVSLAFLLRKEKTLNLWVVVTKRSGSTVGRLPKAKKDVAAIGG
jgi:hypothetical protein